MEAAGPSQPYEPMWMPHLERLDLESALQEGTAAPDIYAEVLESICGSTDDSQAVEQYDGSLGVTAAFVASHQSAVAQVQWNDNLASLYTSPGNVNAARWGTGTMISRNLFLTCGHLFDQTGGGWERPRQNGTTNIISPQEIAQNMHLNFNYQVDPDGNLRTEQRFAIAELIEYRLGGIDMAICRITGNPGDTYGWTPVATNDAADNDMLCIIGHPAGVPKRIEAGPTLTLSGNLIRYNDIDTLGGNSGSGILRAATGDLVGVHTNGGCNASGTGSNFGQRISSVRAVSPTLQALDTSTAIIRDIATDFGRDVATTTATRDKPVISDIATSAVRDVLATTSTRDKPVLSDIGTGVRRDLLVPTKPVDDVKHAGLDKQFDNPIGFDPVRGRPFVLSTPHHAPGVGRQETQAVEYEEVLGQLGAAIMEQQRALELLAEQYQAVAAEYQELFG